MKYVDSMNLCHRLLLLELLQNLLFTTGKKNMVNHFLKL